MTNPASQAVPSSSIRQAAAALITAAVAGVGIWMNIAVQRVEPERWFLPGALGYEPGVPARREGSRVGLPRRGDRDVGSDVSSSGRDGVPALPNHQPAITINSRGERGFTSRVFDGGPGREGDIWERRNGRTAGVVFMHNLDTVFPRELLRSRPEFAPLADGVRLNPPAGGRVFWQPDLGREDVAVFAADAAGQYFEANPQAESFSLGINDGLIFGESAETLEALRRGDAAAEDRGRRTEDGPVQMSDGRGQRPDNGQRMTDGSSESGLGPESSVVAGQSPAARPASGWFRNRPDYSPLVFTFLNRAAAELEKTHPDKYLGALAYYWAENTPGFSVNPHVIPFLTADRSQGYDPAFWKEEFALQERWAGAMGIRAGNAAEDGRQRTDDGQQRADGGSESVIRRPSSAVGRSALRSPPSALRPRLGLYDYLDGPGFLIPRIHTRLIAENLQHAWEAGFTDYYAEGAANWGVDGPMHWLVAQLTQDPTQSRERLLEEYYRRMYGPAAAPMRAFFERCEEIWMNQPRPTYWLKYYYTEAQAGLFPAAVRAELRGLLTEAESKVGLPRRGDRDSESNKSSGRDGVLSPLSSVLAGPGPGSRSAYAQRIALTSAAFRVTEAFCTFQEAREALSRRVLEGRAGTPSRPDEIVRDLEIYLKAKANFLATVERVRRDQPLAIAPFELRDYVKNDPTVAALLALAESPEARGQPALRSSQSEAGRRDDRGQTPDGGRQTSEVSPLPSAISRQVEPALRPPPSAIGEKLRQLPGLPAGWESLFTPPMANRTRIERDGGLMGPIQPARRIAGLEYGVALPASWFGNVQPFETHRAVLLTADADGRSQKPEVRGQISEAGSSPSSALSPRPSVFPESADRILRVSGTKDTSVSQWNLIPQDGGQKPEDGRRTSEVSPRPSGVGSSQPSPGDRSFITAAVQMRGKVSPGNLSVLTLGWMDANLRSIGFSTLRLPEGTWNEWTTLTQGAQPPPDAQWVGFGLRVEHQTGDDWIEVRDFELTK